MNRSVYVAILATILAACGDTPTGVVPPPEADQLQILDYMPRNGASVAQNDALMCRASIVETHGRPVTVSWTFDGEPSNCQELSSGQVRGNQVLRGIPPSPVSQGTTGEHTLVLKGCGPSACVTQTITVTVGLCGNKLVYGLATNDYGNADIYTACFNNTTEHTRLTSDNVPKLWPMLSPNGRRLFYTRTHQACGSALVMEENGVRKELTGDPDGICAIWGTESIVFSPSGNKIAFVGGDETNFDYTAFVGNGDGTGIKKVVVDNVQPYIDFWSEDEIVTGQSRLVSTSPVQSRRELFRKSLIGGLAETSIYLDAFEQSGQQLKPNLYGLSQDRSWAVVFTPLTTNQIGVMSTNGSGSIRPVTNPGEGDQPFPCGATTVCYRRSRRELWAVEIDGSNKRLIKTALDGTYFVNPRLWIAPTQ